MRRDLSAIDRDIGQDWSRIIQEAFKHGIDCDMIFGGLLAGRLEQGLHERSDTQNYLMGTRRITPDGRVFRYAKAVGTLQCDYACKFVAGEIFEYVALGATQAVKDSQVTLVVTPGEVLAEDELKGGYISIFKAGLGDSINRKITGNTALAVGGASITIYLDDPLDRIVTITVDHAEVLPNPYLKVKDLQASGCPDSHASVAGLPNVPATDGQFCWIQTWGFRWMSPTQSATGGVARERAVYFDDNGGVSELTFDSSGRLDRQLAGFLVDATSAGVDGAPFIMLQICP